MLTGINIGNEQKRALRSCKLLPRHLPSVYPLVVVSCLTELLFKSESPSTITENELQSTYDVTQTHVIQ